VSYAVAIPTPRTPQIGRALALTLPLYSEAGVLQTVASGTITVRLGSQVLVDELAITPGAPPSYTLLATATQDLAPSDEYQEIWTTPLGQFTHGGFLVRHAYYSTVNDTHLQERHPELLQLLPPGETTAEKFRRQANEKIQRDLLKQGRRPWLIVDAWALHDAEKFLALHTWANDAAMRTSGTSDYLRLAREYLAAYEREMGSVSFRFDESESGQASSAMESAEASGIVLSAGPRRRRVA